VSDHPLNDSAEWISAPISPYVSAKDADRRVFWIAWIALAVAAVWVRTAGLHAGLLYPDGYDYLLMARGIASHLQPTLHLGPGGVLFSPPLDAAVKPMFPALTALLSAVMPLRTAANVVTVAGGAGTVVFAGLLCLRLTGSQAAGLTAGVCALVSPALSFWSGFTGPDALAPALALAAMLLVLDGRAAWSGIVAAMSVATRPEWALAWAVIAVVALVRRERRAAAVNALIAAAFTLALVLAVLRPPLGAHFGLHAGGVGAGAVLGSGAARSLLRDDWPLLALALFGVFTALRRGLRREAFVMLAVLAVLCAAYLAKNPGSERYLSQLVPLLCVCAGFAVLAIPGRLARLALGPGAVTAAALLWLTAAEPTLGDSQFAAVAAKLRTLPAGRIVTAAPEAYGYLLPGRRIELMRPGAHGLIVLDGAQRTYAPSLTAVGKRVGRVRTADGFERPDGTIDEAPTRLVRGAVAVKTG
jgi:hypothetical protein